MKVTPEIWNSLPHWIQEHITKYLEADAEMKERLKKGPLEVGTPKGRKHFYDSALEAEASE